MSLQPVPPFAAGVFPLPRRERIKVRVKGQAIPLSLAPSRRGREDCREDLSLQPVPPFAAGVFPLPRRERIKVRVKGQAIPLPLAPSREGREDCSEDLSVHWLARLPWPDRMKLRPIGCRDRPSGLSEDQGTTCLKWGTVWQTVPFLGCRVGIHAAISAFSVGRRRTRTSRWTSRTGL